jgi:alpha-beta hydrolase superfamily lysophospholipase
MRRFLRGVVRVLVTFLGTIGVLYVGLCVYLRATSPAWLYDLPVHGAPVAPAGATMRTLRAADGVVVHALDLTAPRDDAPVVVVFHGNGESIGDWGDVAEALAARGLGVTVTEYRGFGVSAEVGSPSEEGLYRDAEAVLDDLAARGIGRDRIILLGQSLGTGVAAEMARREKGRRLVLISPYTAILDLTPKGLPLPASILLADRFATLAKAPAIHLPTLIFHGDADEEVPFAMGQRLAGAIEGATLHVIPGGHHNDLFQRWLWRREIVEAIAEFAGAKGTAGVGFANGRN